MQTRKSARRWAYFFDHSNVVFCHPPVLLFGNLTNKEMVVNFHFGNSIPNFHKFAGQQMLVLYVRPRVVNRTSGKCFKFLESFIQILVLWKNYYARSPATRFLRYPRKLNWWQWRSVGRLYFSESISAIVSWYMYLFLPYLKMTYATARRLWKPWIWLLI